jgi:hypothetical protein
MLRETKVYDIEILYDARNGEIISMIYCEITYKE